MTKPCFILLLLLANYSNVVSQEKFDLVVKDSLLKPIIHASVIWSKNMGLVTDTDGHVQIPNKNRIDSIIVSAIGYNEVVIPKWKMTEKDSLVVILKCHMIELPQIAIASYPVENEYGITGSTSQTSYIKNSVCTNLQGALKITGYPPHSKCKSIAVLISRQSSNEIPYRLRLYSINDSGVPGKDLLNENIAVYLYTSNKWNIYGLDTLNILLPEDGFFVAIEWLCTDIKANNGLCVGLTNKEDKALTYYKYGSEGWIQLRYKSEISKDNIMLKVKIGSSK